MKFTEAWHNLKHWSLKRREELLPIILERTNNVVQHGPFEGMVMVPECAWGDGDHMAKLIGTYESELYECAETHIKSSPSVIINIGCAEGFWAIGLAKRTGAPVILVDINPELIAIAKKNAEANGVTVLKTSVTYSPSELEQDLSSAHNPIVVSDCEGAEELYIDPAAVPSLSKTRIIVETHDCIKEGLAELLAVRCQESHAIEVVFQGSKNPYVDPINDFGDEDKWVIVNENRPSTMIWLSMTPLV